METLSLWDEPQIYSDINFYMAVNALLVFLKYEDNPIQQLSADQSALLKHLVSGSLEATCAAFEKAALTHQHEIIEILEALTSFADEVTQ
jgi:hypothetical protein